MSEEGPEILFDEGEHKYTVAGVNRPSVTTILQDLGFIDFSFVPANILANATARGKAIHAAIHYLQEGNLDWSSIDPRIRPYIDAYELFSADMGWCAKLIEHRVFSEIFQYAGTLDGFGELSALGIPEALIDLKSGIKQRAAAYQTAGYCVALEKPYIPRFSVHLKATGRYQIIPHKNYDDINDWKSIVRTFHLKHRKD